MTTTTSSPMKEHRVGSLRDETEDPEGPLLDGAR